MTDEVKPGAVKRLAAKAVDRKQWDIPVWAIWLGGFLIFLALAGLVYGAVQHFRVGRWQKLLEESRQVIVKLNNQNQYLKAQAAKAHSDGTGEATSRIVGRITRDDNGLAKRDARYTRDLRDAQAYKRRIKDDIDNSNVQELLAKYAAEGFKGTVVMEPPPRARPRPPPKRKEPTKD